MRVISFTFNGFQENTYIITDDSTKKAVIVDPGCYDRSEQHELIEFIAQEELEIEAIWNTHCHIDHVMGNAFCSAQYGVEIIAHEKEKTILELAQRSADMYGFSGYVTSPQPSIWLKGDEVLTLGQLKIKVLFGPGHSPGHVAFYHAETHQAVVGDILFKGSFGRVDLPGGDLNTLKNSIFSTFFTLPEETVIYPGHGPSTTIGEEKRSNYILQF